MDIEISQPRRSTSNNNRGKQDRTLTENSDMKANNSSNKIDKSNTLRQLTNQYKHLFIRRVKGQKMNSSDAKWILNTFARMRCDSCFYGLTDSQIMQKMTEWCCVGLQTLQKLINNNSIYTDERSSNRDSYRTIPDSYEKKIRNEIQSCLDRGVPCTSKFLQDILAFEGIEASRRTISRALKRWNISFGRVKAADNRKQRQYVLAALHILL